MSEYDLYIDEATVECWAEQDREAEAEAAVMDAPWPREYGLEEWM